MPTPTPSEPKSEVAALLDLLKPDTAFDIHAEGDLWFFETVVIGESQPGGKGGVGLILDGRVCRGELDLTAAMIAGAEPDGDRWRIRHGALAFSFGGWE